MLEPRLKARHPTTRSSGRSPAPCARRKARQARADEIERRLAAGQSVIELDAALVEPSFVSDRMPGEIDGLVASIRDQGQQVPILVRPHPRSVRALSGRLRPPPPACAEGAWSSGQGGRAGFERRAMVIAQGQENNERQDLSYIEKARFAQRLRERFARDVITAAMSIDKTELSRMLSIVDAIPAELIEAIGPAPGIGRRSWAGAVGSLGEDRSRGCPSASANRRDAGTTVAGPVQGAACRAETEERRVTGAGCADHIIGSAAGPCPAERVEDRNHTRQEGRARTSPPSCSPMRSLSSRSIVPRSTQQRTRKRKRKEPQNVAVSEAPICLSTSRIAFPRIIVKSLGAVSANELLLPLGR